MKRTQSASNVLFKKTSLPERVADTLRDLIGKGIWKDYLPTERSLSLKVEASRPTVRKALHILADTGLVKITAGHPTKIIRYAVKKRVSVERRHVVMLTSRSSEGQGYWRIMFIDELQLRLNAHGYSFEVITDHRLPRRRINSFLKELVQHREANFWVLSSVGLAVQSWFQDQRISSVVDGSTFPQITLPSADFDHLAIGRHAGGVLLGLGHRRIALVSLCGDTAGEQAMERGCLKALEKHPHASLIAVIHTGEVNVIRSRLKSLLASKERPTAIIVGRSTDFIVVMSSLLEWGFRIPNDISLIAEHPDAFMDRLTPPPARYAMDPIKQARAAFRLLENPSFGRGRIRQIPEFSSGGSLASPPSL